MIRSTTIMANLLCSAFLLTSGCASTGLSPLQYGHRRIEAGDRSVVFDAARDVLIDQGYRLESADPVAGVIITQPAAVASGFRGEQGLSLLTGPGFTSSRSMRRFAEVRLSQSITGINIYCKVALQRQATEALRMFQHDSTVSDIPSETAIEREGATTVEQNVFWQTVRRDKTAERRILEAIIKRAEQQQP